MDNPKLSPAFNVSDIRALRDFNSLRHRNMTAEQIKEESRPAVERCTAYIDSLRAQMAKGQSRGVQF